MQVYELEFPWIILTSVLSILLSVYFIFRTYRSHAKIAMNPEEWRSFILLEKENVSHDVRRFRFALQSPKHILGLPIGQHISFKYVDTNGKEVQRSYTPVTSNDELGYVDFIIKVYFADVNPKFPTGGKMSLHLNNLQIRDSILMKGPKGHLTYKSCGQFSIKHRTDLIQYNKKKIGMIAGGTGITPMLQIIRAILKNPHDKTELWLLFANQTEDDIFLRKDLESIPKDRLHVWYTVDRPPADWSYSSGFINTDMCRNHLPPPSNESMIFLCGPTPMIKFACEPALKELGFNETDWFAL